MHDKELINNTEGFEVSGYKVFNKDWTCRGKQYMCPGEFEEDGELLLNKHGMHFCKNIYDVFINNCILSRELDDNLVHIAHIKAVGDVVEDEITGKCCTNHLKIVNELSLTELINLIDLSCFIDKINMFTDYLDSPNDIMIQCFKAHLHSLFKYFWDTKVKLEANTEE